MGCCGSSLGFLSGWACRLCSVIGQGHWMGSLPGLGHRRCSTISQCPRLSGIIGWVPMLSRLNIIQPGIAGPENMLNSWAGLLPWIPAWAGQDFLVRHNWKLSSRVGGVAHLFFCPSGLMEWAPQRVRPIGWGPINDLVKEELKKLKLDVEMGNVLIKGFRGYSMTCRVLQSGHRSCDLHSFEETRTNFPNWLILINEQIEKGKNLQILEENHQKM